MIDNGEKIFVLLQEILRNLVLQHQMKSFVDLVMNVRNSGRVFG